MLLDGKRLLITGVLTEKSIAYAVADRALAEGAEVVLTGFGRGMRITERMTKRLQGEPDVLELDVNDPATIEAVAADLEGRWGALDGVLHAIAFVPPDALGGNFLTAPSDSARGIPDERVLVEGPCRRPPAAAGEGRRRVVGLDFDASRAWPSYDWAGVSKAALESVNRYLARDLGPRGVRSNLVAAGPLNTMAARSIDGFEELAGIWEHTAPLGWDLDDPTAVADACLFLLSPLSRAITGAILHVDGGVHAIGATATKGSVPPAAQR